MIVLEEWSRKQATKSQFNKAEIRLFPNSSVVKVSTSQCRRCRFDPWLGKIPWRWEWQPTPVFLPGESHEQRSLVGYSPWGHKEKWPNMQSKNMCCPPNSTVSAPYSYEMHRVFFNPFFAFNHAPFCHEPFICSQVSGEWGTLSNARNTGRTSTFSLSA